VASPALVLRQDVDLPPTVPSGKHKGSRAGNLAGHEDNVTAAISFANNPDYPRAGRSVTTPPPYGDPDYNYGQWVPPAGYPPQQYPPQQYPPQQYPPQQYPPQQYPPQQSYYQPMGQLQFAPPTFDYAAPQPGVIPLRRSGLNSGDVMSGITTAYRRDWRSLFGVSAIVNGIQYFLLIILGVITLIMALPAIRQLADLPDNPTSEQLRPILPGLLLKVAIALVIFVFVNSICRMVLGALVSVIVGEDTVARKIGVREALGMIRPVLNRLILQGIVSTLGFALGIVLLVIPAIWLFGVWTALAPAVAQERTTVRGAFGRSRRLLKGLFWRTIGIRLLAVLLATAVSYVLALPLRLGSLIEDSSTTVAIIVICIFGLAQFLISMVTGPITAIACTLLYFDARMRKERLAEQLQAGVPPRSF